jgi:hypothetical protein
MAEGKRGSRMGDMKENGRIGDMKLVRGPRGNPT